MSSLLTLYQKDYTAWAKQTAELLKAERFSELDIEHLLEELESMGASERNELESRLSILLAHLLKWQFQYQQLSDKWKEFDGRSWRYTIIEQRTRLAKRLRKSPGLKSSLPEVIAEAYEDALELAIKETQLPASTFPEQCPYGINQILDDEFYPGD
ncbi:DUF29 domain-containing protein [Candidatus Venteria ishoeyi]|nr:DUF29 domain-containing protein [Candidatus Venteria ishoeyi]MDM8546305.1 DUF29 domain-containing protein [Candidatus Venteria ishoeyi]